MTASETRYIEDALYRDSESPFFTLPEELRDALDIPAFMRQGSQTSYRAKKQKNARSR